MAADGVTALQLSGEFDLAGIPTFDAAAAELVDHVDVVLDVNDLTFIDSTGLERLLKLQCRLEGMGHRIVLRHPQRQMLRVLELTGSLALFDLEDVTNTASERG